eukprot:4259562-Amphidinium_carterae.2
MVKLLGMYLWRIWPDALHILDLGVYQHMHASALFCLADAGIWEGTMRQEKLDETYKNYAAWCSKMDLPAAARFSEKKLARSSRCAPMFSALARGAQTMTQWLLCILEHITGDNVEEASEELTLLFTMYQHFGRFEQLCEERGRFLSKEDSARIATLMEGGLLCYGQLQKLYEERGSERFHIIPKAHMATHLGYDLSLQVNPRTMHNYSDEDFMGLLKKSL